MIIATTKKDTVKRIFFLISLKKGEYLSINTLSSEFSGGLVFSTAVTKVYQIFTPSFAESL